VNGFLNRKLEDFNIKNFRSNYKFFRYRDTECKIWYGNYLQVKNGNIYSANSYYDNQFANSTLCSSSIFFSSLQLLAKPIFCCLHLCQDGKEYETKSLLAYFLFGARQIMLQG